jgi:hypothetical protein
MLPAAPFEVETHVTGALSQFAQISRIQLLLLTRMDLSELNTISVVRFDPTEHFERGQMKRVKTVTVDANAKGLHSGGSSSQVEARFLALLWLVSTLLEIVSQSPYA